MIYQTNSTDCGRAVIRNYLSFVKKDEKFETLYFKEKLQDFLSMKEELECYGIEVEGRLEGDLNNIPKANYPFILQVVYQENRSHFILITKKVGKKFKVIDSEFGEYFLDYKEISEISTGRVLITKNVKKEKIKLPKIYFFSKMEIFLYCSLFVLQATTLTLLFYYLNADILFEIKIGMIVFSFLLIFSQVILNKMVRKRLDKEILIPYLKESKSFNDYANLSTLITLNINRASSLLSYGITCVLSLFIFISNGNFVLLLGFTSLLFSLIIYLLKNQYNKMNRNCSLKEEEMKNGISNNKFEESFYEARSIASTFEEGTLSLTILEALVLSLLTFLEMGFGEKYSLNFYLFYLFLGMSFTVMFYKLLKNMFDTSKIKLKINTLSIPLDISMKSFFHLVYNKSVKNGGIPDGRKSTHPRLSRQHSSKEKID